MTDDGNPLDDYNTSTGLDNLPGFDSKDLSEYDLPTPLTREWMAHRHRNRFNDLTKRNYSSSIRMFVDFLDLKGTSIVECELKDVIDFFDFRSANGRALNTGKGDQSAIKDLLRYIVIRTDEDPNLNLAEFDEIKLSGFNWGDGFERGSLDVDEIEALFDHLESRRSRIMVYLGVFTGLRNSDLRKLRLENVDYDEQEIHVPDPKYDNSYEVPMSNELTYRLKRWEKVGRKSYLTHQTSEYMFPSKKGPYLETNPSFNNMVKEAAERAGIQKVVCTTPALPEEIGRTQRERNYHRVTAHTLRHSFLDLLRDNNIPPESRKVVAGHQNVETTLEYGDEPDDYHEEVRRVLNIDLDLEL